MTMTAGATHAWNLLRDTLKPGDAVKFGAPYEVPVHPGGILIPFGTPARVRLNRLKDEIAPMLIVVPDEADLRDEDLKRLDGEVHIWLEETSVPPIVLVEPCDLAALAKDARPTSEDDDYDDYDAENKFFCVVRAIIGREAFEDLERWCLKATTNERIDEALRRISGGARPKSPFDRTSATEQALVQLLLAFAKGELSDNNVVEREDVEIALQLAKDALPGEYERILDELRNQDQED